MRRPRHTSKPSRAARAAARRHACRARPRDERAPGIPWHRSRESDDGISTPPSDFRRRPGTWLGENCAWIEKLDDPGFVAGPDYEAQCEQSEQASELAKFRERKQAGARAGLAAVTGVAVEDARTRHLAAGGQDGVDRERVKIEDCEASEVHYLSTPELDDRAPPRAQVLHELRKVVQTSAPPARGRELRAA